MDWSSCNGSLTLMNGQALVGRNVRRLRVALGLTQKALVVDAGLDRSYVGRIDRATENPTVDSLDQLAAALAVESCCADPRTENPLLQR